MMTAGAPPPPSLMRALEKETGIKAGTAYGLTESYGPSTLHIPDDPEEYPGATDGERDGMLQVGLFGVVGVGGEVDLMLGLTPPHPNLHLTLSLSRHTPILGGKHKRKRSGCR